MDNIHRLEIGVVICLTDPLIILSTNGTFRFLENGLRSSLKVGEIVLFKELPSEECDYINFVLPISEFRYYKNIRCHNRECYNKELYAQGLCIPQEILKESTQFIIDNGYGYQFIIYCEYNNIVYADWKYTNLDQDLLKYYFRKKSKPDINKILLEIDQYIDTIDANSIMESFTIINKEVFISKPGKDDYYYVKKESNLFEDQYIASLFPVINETVYDDCGYCDAYSMRINPVVRGYNEEEQFLIASAKQKYNKEEHRRFLVNERIEETLYDIEQDEKNILNIYKSFFSKAFQLMKDENVNFQFCYHYNELLRSLGKVINNDMDWNEYHTLWNNFFNVKK